MRQETRSVDQSYPTFRSQKQTYLETVFWVVFNQFRVILIVAAAHTYGLGHLGQLGVME